MNKIYLIFVFSFFLLFRFYPQIKPIVINKTSSFLSLGENIILSPDSVYFPNYFSGVLCDIINYSDSIIYLDSIYSYHYFGYYCRINLNSYEEPLSFFIRYPYSNYDTLHFAMNPNDTLKFIINDIDWCPICKTKQILDNYNDTLYFVFSNDIDTSLSIKSLRLYGDFSTDVKDKNNSASSFSLSQNYPNPFNPITKIKYSVPILEKGHAQSVILKVFDVLGNEIVTLVDGYKSSGAYEVEFNANVGANNYSPLPSGVYFYQLRIGDLISTKKLILLK